MIVDLDFLNGIKYGERQGSALETARYRRVKRFLENLAFEVKGEIWGCDPIALRGGRSIRAIGRNRYLATALVRGS